MWNNYMTMINTDKLKDKGRTIKMEMILYLFKTYKAYIFKINLY